MFGVFFISLTPTIFATTNKNLNDMGKNTSFKLHETTLCLIFLVSQSKSWTENCFLVINSEQYPDYFAASLTRIVSFHISLFHWCCTIVPPYFAIPC